MIDHVKLSHAVQSCVTAGDGLSEGQRFALGAVARVVDDMDPGVVDRTTLGCLVDAITGTANGNSACSGKSP